MTTHASIFPNNSLKLEGMTTKKNKNSRKVPGVSTVEAMVLRSAEQDDLAAVFGGIAMLSFMEEHDARDLATSLDGEMDIDLYEKHLNLVEKRQRIRLRSATALERSKVLRHTGNITVMPDQWEKALDDHKATVQ